MFDTVRYVLKRYLNNLPEPVAAKVPEITAMFWLVKILTTGMGEAMSDYLGSVSIPVAGFVGLFGFILAMWLQLRTTRYVAYIYWFAVAMVAVFGTMVADVVHVAGLPYVASTAIYAVALAVAFYVWHNKERTLSIHSILTSKRERFYWLTVLLTFALGTAAGDLTAAEMNLGYFASGLIFAAAILVPLIAWWKFGLNEVIAFWYAYIITRPLGASFADWLGKEHSRSGLGWGDGPVSGIAALAIIFLVTYLALRRNDIQSSMEQV